MLSSMRTIRNVGRLSYKADLEAGMVRVQAAQPADQLCVALAPAQLTEPRNASDSGSISRNRTDPPASSSRSSNRVN